MRRGPSLGRVPAAPNCPDLGQDGTQFLQALRHLLPLHPGRVASQQTGASNEFLQHYRNLGYKQPCEPHLNLNIERIRGGQLEEQPIVRGSQRTCTCNWKGRSKRTMPDTRNPIQALLRHSTRP